MNNNPNIINNQQPNNMNPIPNNMNNNFANNVSAIPPMNQNPTGQFTNNSTLQNNYQNQTPINNNQNITLGTTNNTTYADTIGNVIPNNQANVENVAPTQNVDDNRFITANTTVDNTALNDLNVSGTYNNMEAPEYVNDTKVTENIQGITKKTIPITSELKTVILIAILLLAFIIFMPLIFDLLNNIRFH